jgi:hypothetical protein
MENNQEEKEKKEEIKLKPEFIIPQKPSLIKQLMQSLSLDGDKNSFPMKYFSCCTRPEIQEPEIKRSYIYERYNGDDIVNGVPSLFPKKYIREDELDIIKTFDEKNIITFFENMQKDENFFRKIEKLNNGYEFSLFMKDRNDFSASIPTTRVKIEIPVSKFQNISNYVEEISQAIIDPDKRMSWDKNFVKYKTDVLNDQTEILNIVVEEKNEIILPREFLDKRTHFMDKDIFYCYSSSIPETNVTNKEEIKPDGKKQDAKKQEEIEENIKVMDFFGIFSIQQVGQKIIIDSFHQLDIKIGQPGPLIFLSLPLKICQFTEGLINFLNGTQN